MMKLKLSGLKVGVISLVSHSVLLVVLSMMISALLVKVNTVKNVVSGMANALAAVCFALFRVIVSLRGTGLAVKLGMSAYR